jgi:hypothetical protein
LASRRIDTEIDRLYQLPPDEFTAARNALAKDAGADRAEVRALAKPPLAAWAVNQIYWKQRNVYEALIAASNELRKLHKAVLSGRQADIRDAGRAHDAAVEAALKAALGILRDESHPATDATRQAIMTTLRALPADDPPGRLTRTLQPGGFEMLAGLSIAGTKGRVQNLRDRTSAVEQTPAGSKAQPPTRATAPPSAAGSKADQRKAAQEEAAQARAARDAAARAVREAEQVVRREQFEAARLTRDATRAAKELDAAREAVRAAEEALQHAEAEAATASRQRAAAVTRAKESERALDAARAAARKR